MIAWLFGIAHKRVARHRGLVAASRWQQRAGCLALFDFAPAATYPPSTN